MARRPAVAWMVAAIVLATTAGCTTTVVGAASPADTAPPLPPTPPITPSTGGPVYDGPPSDAPGSQGPPTSLRAVELTPALPGVPGWADAAVAAPGGGAYVALRDVDATTERLVTVTASGEVSAVPIPAMDEPDMHVLGDGRVVLAGQFRSTGQGGPGESPDFGFQVVDPDTGEGRQTVVVPFADGTDYSYDESALSADGRTLYLYVAYSLHETSSRPDPPAYGSLFAVDLASGVVLAEHDVNGDLTAFSIYTSGVYASGLVARPHGGVSLVFDATPSAADDAATIPSVFFFDRRLRFDGAVQLAALSDRLETDAVAGAADGTVFAVLSGGEAPVVVAVPDGGGAGTLLAQLAGASSAYGFAVEPAQEWSLVHTGDGLQPLNLVRGDLRDPLRLDCEGQGVREVYPGEGDVGALLLGECDDPGPRTQMLWLATA